MRITVAVVVACFGLVGMTTANDAQALVRQPTNIAAQELAPALNILAKDRNLQLVYRSDLVKDQRTDGAAGDLTFEEVLTQLLNGTGLTYKFLANNAITILPIVANSPSAVEGGEGSVGKDPSSALSTNPPVSAIGGGGGGEASSGEAPKSFWSRLRLAQNSPNTSSSLQGQNPSSSGETKDRNNGESGDIDSASRATLEEVVVTAERRSNDVQKTATSVSVRTGQELEQQGRYTLADILRDIPGVSGGEPLVPTAGGSEMRGNGIVIRGVTGGIDGGGAGGTITGSATTATYVDGVYEGLGGDYDIQRVEVLRGPQGTLYGRSATSGVVATYTRNPTFDAVSGFGAAQFGNYSRRLYTGALNIPFNEQLAIRTSVNKSEGTGYYNGDGSAFDFIDGRVKVLYQPTANFSALLGFAFEEHDKNTGGCNATSPAVGVILYNNCLGIAHTHNDGRQYWLDVKWDLGPVALYYQPALRTYHQTAVAPFVGPKQLALQRTLQTPSDQFVTQELRLASNTDGKLTWQTGLFYYWNDIREVNRSTWVSSGALVFDSPSTRDTKDYGAFGEGTYAFTDATRLTLGVRYDYTRVDSTQVYTQNTNLFCQTTPLIPPAPNPVTCTTPTAGIGFPEVYSVLVANENSTPSGLNSWRKVNYKVRLEHDLTPQNLLYGMVSTGFIPGDVSIRNAGVSRYDAETLTAYEVGSKNRFLDNRLQINGDVYYYNYGGLQQRIDIDPNNPSTSFTATIPARMKGLEFEALYQLTASDRLGLNYAYQDCWYVDKPAQFAANIRWTHCARMAATSVFSRINAPSTVNANYEHVFNLPGGSTLLTRIDGTWHSAYQNFNPSNFVLTSANIGAAILQYSQISSGAVGNINVNWSAPGDRYAVGAYVNNFTDRRWITYEVSSLNPQAVNAFQSDPRTYGVILTARF